MVVRPKIRKQTSETHLEKRKSSYGEEEKSHDSGSSGRTAAGGKTKCVSAPPFFLTQTERPNHDLLFSFPLADCAGVIPIERRRGGRREAEEGYKVSSDEEEGEEEELDDIWEDLDFNDKCPPFMKAEERYNDDHVFIWQIFGGGPKQCAGCWWVVEYEPTTL